MGRRTPDDIESEIGRMSLVDRERLLVVIRDSIEHELSHDDETDDEEIHACPRCGDTGIVRKGRSRGRQRYLCHGCGRTFDGRTGRILSTSKLPASMWLAYAQCMVDGLTLRDAAGECGVGLKTSLLVRHRVCECMERHLSAFEVDSGCSAEIDEKFVRENFKGNHTRNPGFPCPVA